jgi:hypothetical protein
VVEELPSGGAGEMFPIAVMTTGVGMAPRGAAGVTAIGDIVVVNAVIVAVVLMTVDGAGTAVAIIEGDGRGGSAGGCGAGMVEPGKSLMNDVAGCAYSVRNGVAVLPVVDVEELAETAGVVVDADIDDVAAVVPAIGDKEVIGAAGVPGAICPVGVAQVTTVPGIVG